MTTHACNISDLPSKPTHMEHTPIGNSPLSSSRLIYGCMRLSGLKSTKAVAATLAATVDAGYNHFDHADIYGSGECESLFGEWLAANPSIRDKCVITTKAGIRFADTPKQGDPFRYDFSANYILQQAEASLKRLQIETIDLFLLHRPDYLFHPEEVAGAFEKLHKDGKVRHFGISNFRTSQVELLAKACPMPLINHQIEINLHQISSLEDGTLDQCLLHNMTPTAWCPLGALAYPAWGNTFSAEDEKRIETEVQRQAEAYKAKPSQIALAWILKLPSKVLPIIGSTKPDRIREAVRALELNYSKEDWYRLLEARNGARLP